VEGEVAVQFGEGEDGGGLSGGVEGVLDDCFLEQYHLLVDALGVGTV
jgi:hypothetical protein